MTTERYNKKPKTSTKQKITDLFRIVWMNPQVSRSVLDPIPVHSLMRDHGGTISEGIVLNNWIKSNQIKSNQIVSIRNKKTYSYRIDSKDSSVDGVIRLYWTVDGTDGVDGGGRVEGASLSVRSIGLIIIEFRTLYESCLFILPVFLCLYMISAL